MTNTMILPRDLLYKDHTFDYFDVHNKSIPFSFFYNRMLNIPAFHPTNKYAFSNILHVFNNALYICIDAKLQDYPELSLHEYIKVANDDDESTMPAGVCSEMTLAIVHFFLTNSSHFSENHKKLANYIYSALAEVVPNDLNSNDNPYFGVDLIHDSESLNVFEMRDSWFEVMELTPAHLLLMDFQKITNDYDPDYIEKIVNKVGRSYLERLHLAERIMSSFTIFRQQNDPTLLPF